MKKTLFFVSILIVQFGFSQKTLSKLLKQQNKETIPYISVEELNSSNEDIILLDSREPKEFKTSHLKNAKCVGYDFFNMDSTATQLPNNKDVKIVVYCSLGIRSEDVAEKLKKAGYTNVFNLYGGIFEWKNKDMTVYDSEEKVTENVHTFNKDWSKWLKKGTKIYD